MNYYCHQSFHIHSHYVFENKDLKELIRRFQRSFHPSRSVLGGRNEVCRVSLPNIGPVVIKQYSRGGLLHKIVKERYLRLGKPRCRLEFDYLSQLSSLGLKVPEPVAYAFKGKLIYRAWLITLEIPNLLPLAEVSADSTSKFESIMDSLVAQVSILVDHAIFHPDLHPGNAFVTPDNSIYLLDFDKASLFPGKRQKLEKKYLLRWQRAVSKHGLPQVLAESFSEKFARSRVNSR